MELIKRAARALKEPAAWAGWKLAEAFIGGAVGFLMAAAYLRYR
ncbi:hypothetical protein ACF1BE_18745 [Streptomyces sp. NPDC014991]